MNELAKSVSEHYGHGGLKERIRSAMEQAGMNTDSLTVTDLAPVDQFHTGGLIATRKLAEFTGAQKGLRVLDLGSGLGGVARYFAAEHGYTVTGIDLTEEFCEVARWLSGLAGLGDLTTFQQGDATALPFEEGRFDLAVTMQAQMNIADKQKFYGEILRVLKPGGRFLFQEVVAGAKGEPHFPLPWAGRPEISFLIPPEELRVMLEELGFKIEQLLDISPEVLEWRKRHPPKEAGERPPLGIHLVMVEEFVLRQANQTRNLDEGRVAYARGAAIKPG